MYDEFLDAPKPPLKAAEAKKRKPRHVVGPDAFAYFCALGEGRTYEQVAAKLGVTPNCIATHAVRERWYDRVELIQLKALETMDAKLGETVAQMKVRQVKMLRAIQTKILEALNVAKLDVTHKEAIDSLLSSIKQELVIRGEASERTTIGVEQIIRQESARWINVNAHDDDEVIDVPAKLISPPKASAKKEKKHGSSNGASS